MALSLWVNAMHFTVKVVACETGPSAVLPSDAAFFSESAKS
jgi:hypothetical protein